MVPPQQVAEWYQLGDLFVSASSSETQGLTYVEALAAGVPALCRADPCLSGVIRDGENGWQFRDFSDFMSKLETFRAHPELRRALSCALSRSTLIDDNVASGGFVALSPISSKWYLYDSSAVSRGADAAYTESVLESAGYLLTEQGVRATAGGKRLSLRLLYNNANSERGALAASVANQLSSFGYEVSVTEAGAQEYSSLVQSGSFDLYLGEIRLTPDMDVAPLVQSGGALNFARFSSPTLDSALQSLKSASPQELAAAATVLIAALDSEMPLIPLYFALGEVALGEQALRGVLAPTASNPLAGIENLRLSS